jgi:exodeoxyribonuclease V alpha subunit
MDVIKVSVKHVVHYNESNGFIIFKGLVNGKTPCTVKGVSIDLEPEIIVDCEGDWKNDPKYGQQFAAKSIKISERTTIDQVYAYLESGAIAGIGPATAGKIVNLFGENTFSILDEYPERLKEINGIKDKTLNKIIESWKEKRGSQKIIKEILKADITYNIAVKIYKEHGDETLDVIRHNPYSLTSIRGVNFLIADKIALANGLKEDDFSRVLHAIMHVVNEKEFKTGDTCIEKNELIKSVYTLIRQNKDLIEITLEAGIISQHLYKTDVADKTYIQQAYTYELEFGVAQNLKRLISAKSRIDNSDIDKKIDDFFVNNDMNKDPDQKNAIRNVFDQSVSVITGGPGVGKTTILKGVLDIILSNVRSKNEIALCAPTGKAAKRMSESTGLAAKTIHRLLEYNPSEQGFSINESNKLSANYIVIDESSMSDLYLFFNLVISIKTGAHLIVIGDVDQLPSVGYGAILRDLINSRMFSVNRLNKIQRQAKNSKIIVNAHRVNQGLFFDKPNKDDIDFFYIKSQNDQDTLQKVMDLITHKIPQKFNLRTSADIQCLTPMHKGLVGAENLNKELQKVFNNEQFISGHRIKHGDREFCINDKIIQVKNNYEKMVFNGDVGKIVDISGKNIICQYDDVEVEYQRDELDEIGLFYCGTIHKSQGSEFPCVIIPLGRGFSPIMDRSLLYTGITRAKILVIVIGSPADIERAIKNKRSRERNTLLEYKLIN